MALTFVRTSELIGARWEEIDLTKKEWRIPAKRMKMKTSHIVPLSDQAIAVLQELKSLEADEVLLFPSEKRDGKSMSNNTEELRLLCRSLASRWNIHAKKHLETYRRKMTQNSELACNNRQSNCR